MCGCWGEGSAHTGVCVGGRGGGQRLCVGGGGSGICQL